ncbi:glutamine synthetase III [Spirochaetota bacterium]
MDKQNLRKSVLETYGIHRFGERYLRELLPKSVYEELKKVQEGQNELSVETAEAVARAMKDWAVEQGATHYTHWFQPMTGKTAEKHEAFIRPDKDGGILMEFSGKELIQGESDASSFPSGGLRATFEARGYTAWDTSSPAFLNEDPEGLTLYIPTAFVSYNGEALDKKVPLLRSLNKLGQETLKVLKLLGNTGSDRVFPTVGAEQEYFLVERELYMNRPDLRFCGRTLIGNPAPKSQEMDDHYYGHLSDRLSRFMRELNNELWRLGVSAKTQHKEVAPNQFEIATVHSAANVAADENQIVMETITKVAQRHELAALLHEKPFAGVNGSGKHINWSLASNDGLNLLEPGNHPEDNLVFLVFLCAMLETVDKYGLLLRASIASAGNDLRLGAHEAPPNIVSIYLGESLTEILDAASCGNNSSCSDNGTAMHLGSFALPNLPKDLSDRNRTSPFAFTGNKFEYRMPPSGESISTAVAVLNAAYAETMSLYAVKLKNHMDSGNSKEEAVRQVLADSWLKHKRIVFNGNAYSESWHKEALARGLLEAKDSVEAFSAWLDPENVRMLTETGVMSRQEIEALSHIEYERYAKRLLVDATTLLHMAERSAIPAAQNYFASLAGTSEKAQALALENPFMPKLKELLKYITESEKHIQGLKAAMKECNKIEYHTNRALLCRNSILPEIGKLRLAIDSLENLVPKNDWPFPAYEQLLFDI